MKRKIFLTALLVLILVSCVPTAMPVPTETRIAISVPTSTMTPSIIPTPTAKFPLGQTITSVKDGMVQHSVPNGEFTMGTQTDGDWVGEEEMPQHAVYLDGFWMDETEVTNSQYAKCVQDGVCPLPHKTNSYSRSEYYGNPDFDNFPVVQVDWEQAKTYCEWAGRRLPTEAEWEKAARGILGQTYPWKGEAKGEYYANFSIYQVGDTTAVGAYRHGVSPYGVYEMAGNVYEWVADWYSATYYIDSPVINPTGPETGRARVMRGGAWSSDWIFIRSASRMSYYPQDFSGDIGFRCAESQ